MIQPASLNDCVVVQENQVSAARRRRALIAGPAKTLIGRIGDSPHPALEPRKQRRCCVGRTVIDDDDLVTFEIHVPPERSQTLERVIGAVEDWNNNGAFN